MFTEFGGDFAINIMNLRFFGNVFRAKNTCSHIFTNEKCTFTASKEMKLHYIIQRHPRMYPLVPLFVFVNQTIHRVSTFAIEKT